MWTIWIPSSVIDTTLRRASKSVNRPFSYSFFILSIPYKGSSSWLLTVAPNWRSIRFLVFYIHFFFPLTSLPYSPQKWVWNTKDRSIDILPLRQTKRGGELCNETIELQDSVLVFEPEQISAKDGDQLNAPIGYVLEGGERNPLIMCKIMHERWI